MTYPEKRTEVLNIIAGNYEFFISKAKMGLTSVKPYIKLRSYDEDAREIVSDIVYSICLRMNTSDGIQKFWLKKKNLVPYVLKSIWIQTHYLKGPFWQAKIKQQNRYDLPEWVNIMEDEEEEYENKYLELQPKLRELLQPKELLRFAGPQWSYFLSIWREKVLDKRTYRYLSKKYDIPLGSIYADIKLFQNKLKEELSKK
jgi:hypothetical protein